MLIQILLSPSSHFHLYADAQTPTKSTNESVPNSKLQTEERHGRKTIYDMTGAGSTGCPVKCSQTSTYLTSFHTLFQEWVYKVYYVIRNVVMD
jgi:hypothetical protein